MRFQLPSKRHLVTAIVLGLSLSGPVFAQDTTSVIHGRVYLKIYNFLNLLDDEWGLQYDAEFFSPDVVSSTVNAQGQYVYNSFTNKSVNFLLQPQSLWEMRLGV